jgi:hypothetical protein
MGSLLILVNDWTGAPLLSTPNAGKAWLNFPSAKAATANSSAAVTEP